MDESDFQPIIVKNTLNVYHKGDKQTIKYYAGTNKNDVLELIFKTFNLLKPETTFTQLQDNYMFQDDEGDPLVFDPNIIPSGTSISLVFKHIILPTEEKGDWAWDEKWNKDFTHYKLSNGGRIIETDQAGYDPSKPSMPVLISNRPFRTGVHKWRVVWDEPMTYHCVAIVGGDEIKNPVNLMNFGSGFSKVPLFHKTTAFGDKEVKIHLDMNKRTVKVNEKVYTALADEVYAGICFKKNGNTIRAVLHFD